MSIINKETNKSGLNWRIDLHTCSLRYVPRVSILSIQRYAETMQ